VILLLVSRIAQCKSPLGPYITIEYKMLSYRRETALQGAL